MRNFWTDEEKAIIREWYPQGGLKPCADRLPERTWKAIHAQAHLLGIRAPNQPSKRQSYKSTEFIDAAIRQYYQGEPHFNGVNDLAKRINRPGWWISKRAMHLGLVSPRFKEPAWTEQEVELLGQHHWKNPHLISRIFKNHGFKRSATAIQVKRKRHGYRVEDSGLYTGGRLADLMGVNNKTVINWIQKGYLKASRQGTARTELQGGDHYLITPKQVRAFIIDYTAHVDIRKCEKYWLVDLLTNSTGLKEAAA